MENKKNVKKTIIFMVIILITILLVFIVLHFYKLNKQKENNSNTLANEAHENPQISTVNKEDNFELSFLKIENKQENMIYSPLSIKYALKMLQEGASGNTYTQIEKILGNKDLPKYKNIENTVSLANGLFIRDTYNQFVKEDYKNILTDKYNAEIRQDEFKNANNVNSWIEEKTYKRIKNIIKDEMISNPSLKMLLINALAIDMEWENQFNEEDTKGEKFYLKDDTEITATMMSKKTSSNDFSYYIGDDITALTMDLKEYDDTQLEFMAIMPNTDLINYVDALTFEKIDEITQKLNLASNAKDGLNIHIPKFEFDYDLKLKDDLEKIGITDAFDQVLANFSNMADLEKTGTNLYVSDAIHKSNIEFSEEGTKAAAVTVFAISDKATIGDENTPIEININKPFIFLIKDKNTNEIWFVGTVYEPNHWENDEAKYYPNW